MKRLLPILLCLLLLCACGRSEAAPVGTWVNAGQYTEGRDFVETVTLRDDGSLSVHLDYRGEPYADLTGTWELEGERLTFTMDDGTVRVYTFAVTGDELTLKNSDRTVVYARRSAQ
ncbi:MAG: lipocalin family protein [Oscillospiraceae bacterium]|nr:lipocalin family protein [Oscillospiraceae bacterium]